jgi:hypothetical protein
VETVASAESGRPPRRPCPATRVRGRYSRYLGALPLSGKRSSETRNGWRRDIIGAEGGLEPRRHAEASDQTTSTPRVRRVDFGGYGPAQRPKPRSTLCYSRAALGNPTRNCARDWKSCVQASVSGRRTEDGDPYPIAQRLRKRARPAPHRLLRTSRNAPPEPSCTSHPSRSISLRRRSASRKFRRCRAA